MTAFSPDDTPAVRRPLQPFNAIGRAEIDAAVRAMESGPLSGFFGSPQPAYFGGPFVRQFEAAWCERFNVGHAVAVNSATSGLIAAMGAIGISPGDEVIVPPYTMSATAVAPMFYGGVPVFVDIEDTTFCLDYDKVVEAITPRTKAILVVNLFGHPGPLARLRKLADERGIFLVEDNAQAVLGHEDGVLCATIGHIGVYSLNVHKHIQCGEGGVCVTASDDLALRMQMIRNHAENVVEWLGVDNPVNMLGHNFRMLEATAAIAAVQVSRVDELVGRCEHVANHLSRGLSDLEGFQPPRVRPGCRHNYFQWTALYDADAVGISRADFAAALRAEGFPCAEGYVKPIYWLPMFKQRIGMGRHGFPFAESKRHYPAGLCPVTESLYANRVIQFQPVAWDVDDEQADMLIEAVRKVHARARTR